MLVTRIEPPKPAKEEASQGSSGPSRDGKVDHPPPALLVRRIRAGVNEPGDTLSTKIPYGWDESRFKLHCGVVRNHFKVGRLCTFSTYIEVPNRVPRLYSIIQINDHFGTVTWDWSRGVPNCIKIRTVGGSAYDMDMPMNGLRLLTDAETKLVDLQNQPAEGNS